MRKKRYEGLFIAPGMCDGIYDTFNDPNYDHPLRMEKVIDIMNDANNQTEVWKRMYDDMKEKYKRCRKSTGQINAKHQ